MAGQKDASIFHSSDCPKFVQAFSGHAAILVERLRVTVLANRTG
jgi:hypothetical protein